MCNATFSQQLFLSFITASTFIVRNGSYIPELESFNPNPLELTPHSVSQRTINGITAATSRERKIRSMSFSKRLWPSKPSAITHLAISAAQVYKIHKQTAARDKKNLSLKRDTCICSDLFMRDTIYSDLFHRRIKIIKIL